ncbi:hypothetical protein BDQ17DRAFT_1432379 [Cyathus striatus]|nr:hypothetical protein BDQ17DRAFT_1432379 [Cyathus striatus]
MSLGAAGGRNVHVNLCPRANLITTPGRPESITFSESIPASSTLNFTMHLAQSLPSAIKKASIQAMFPFLIEELVNSHVPSALSIATVYRDYGTESFAGNLGTHSASNLMIAKNFNVPESRTLSCFVNAGAD